MKKNFQINHFYIPDFLIILITSFILLLIYNYTNLIFKQDSKDGFLNAKAINNKFNCRLRSQNKNCIENIINDLDSKKSVLFFGNSQTGAINNFTVKDKDFVSLLNENSIIKKNNITIRSFWMPNASLKEFSMINDALDMCSVRPELVIFPAFLDDTRENTIRKFIQDINKQFCENKKETFSDKKDTIGNLAKLNQIIKNRYKILSQLQSLNTRFRTDLYKFRNFIFMIKPNSIRPIKNSSFFSNLNSYEKILVSRWEKNLKTIVYIPPLLYANSRNKIPYNEKEYKIFKKRIKDICDKYNCTFYNLESSIQDDLWGNKASTNLLSKSDEIDFMHFTGKGHLKLSEEFSLIIKKHFINKSYKP